MKPRESTFTDVRTAAFSGFPFSARRHLNRSACLGADGQTAAHGSCDLATAVKRAAS